MEYKDYYAILGVPRGASQADIKKAFRKLARQHHPDVNKGNADAERRFKEINEANAVLGDPEKRRSYDTLGADWASYQQSGRGRGCGQPVRGFRPPVLRGRRRAGRAAPGREASVSSTTDRPRTSPASATSSARSSEAARRAPGTRPRTRAAGARPGARARHAARLRRPARRARLRAGPRSGQARPERPGARRADRTSRPRRR